MDLQKPVKGRILFGDLFYVHSGLSVPDQQQRSAFCRLGVILCEPISHSRCVLLLGWHQGRTEVLQDRRL